MAHRPFYFIYIDESYDDKQFVYVAVIIDAFRWNTYYQNLLDWRRRWVKAHNIPLDSELHATDFVGGRGHKESNRNKRHRAELFYEAIGQFEQIDDLRILAGITATKGKYINLFEAMVKKIQRFLEECDGYGVLICDEGNENQITSKIRKMQRAESADNVVLSRIVEDPLFKNSATSYFIQASDFLAFALLRHDNPTSTTKPKVEKAFAQLNHVLVDGKPLRMP